MFLVASDVEPALRAVLADHEHGQGAATIGRVTGRGEKEVPVVLRTEIGGARPWPTRQ